MKAVVVNLRVEPYDVYVGRAGHGMEGPFGNPFPPEHKYDRIGSVARFRDHFLRRVETDATFRARVLALRGKRLGCFCAPLLCHGSVIADYVNAHFGDTETTDDPAAGGGTGPGVAPSWGIG